MSYNYYKEKFYLGSITYVFFWNFIQVRLIQYNPCYVDESVLWTESDNLIGGFREIRMVNNLDLHFDALTGFIEDGTTLGLFKTNNADNQRWKMVPYS